MGKKKASTEEDKAARAEKARIEAAFASVQQHEAIAVARLLRRVARLPFLTRDARENMDGVVRNLEAGKTESLREFAELLGSFASHR